MAAVLNRTTRQYIPSANTPDYPAADWIINPDLSAVVGFDARYWIITGDVVTLMDAAARAALDAANLTAARDAVAAELDRVESVMRAFALILVDELNAHSAAVNGVLTAINNGSSLASIKTAVSAITPLPTRTAAQIKTAIRNKLGT